jgi:hypothetical protein
VPVSLPSLFCRLSFLSCHVQLCGSFRNWNTYEKFVVCYIQSGCVVWCLYTVNYLTKRTIKMKRLKSELCLFSVCVIHCLFDWVSFCLFVFSVCLIVLFRPIVILFCYI